MAKKKSTGKKEGGDGELLTLSEVSRRTKISMPTLQRYKKLYADRIPSEGEGRKQRYPVSALPVFKKLKEENIGRRGRPKKDGDKAPPPKRKGASSGRGRKKGGSRKTSSASRAGKAATGDLLTLTEIGKRTGISYPTLSRYLKLYGDEIPSEGEGRRRRYYPEAVEVFQRLRSESSRGRGGRRGSGTGRGGRKKASRTTGHGRIRPKSSGDDKRITSLEKSVARLEKKLESLLERLRQPRRLF